MKLNFSKKLTLYQIMAISIGLVYLWFGALKFFPGSSPAEGIAIDTIDRLTFGFIPSNISIILLAIWETAVGILLILNIFKRFAIYLALVHMVFTFSPLFLFPDLTFTQLPFSFTLLGQYIVKNIAFIAALFILLFENRKIVKV